MTQHITFGGGCFWCTEAVFKRLRGVVSVMSGYAGGMVENPTYYQVVAGNTGHAEVIQVEYDPKVIPLEILLSVFFSAHDPTTRNRQGYDVGDQYRSIVLYETDQQHQTIESFMQKLQKDNVFAKPIVTEVKKIEAFYEAEEYHQDYYDRNRDQGYCQVIIDPKIKKLKEKFSEYLKQE